MRFGVLRFATELNLELFQRVETKKIHRPVFTVEFSVHRMHYGSICCPRQQLNNTRFKECFALKNKKIRILLQLYFICHFTTSPGGPKSGLELPVFSLIGNNKKPIF